MPHRSETRVKTAADRAREYRKRLARVVEPGAIETDHVDELVAYVRHLEGEIVWLRDRLAEVIAVAISRDGSRDGSRDARDGLRDGLTVTRDGSVQNGIAWNRIPHAARAPRAPAPARPSESRISSGSQAFLQDPVVVGSSSQDRNGAGEARDARDGARDGLRDGTASRTVTQDRNGPLESDTFATTTSIRKSISERPEKLGPPEGLAVMPSITKTVPPIFDEPKIEAERARQRRALEEFEAAAQKGSSR